MRKNTGDGSLCYNSRKYFQNNLTEGSNNEYMVDIKIFMVMDTDIHRACKRPWYASGSLFLIWINVILPLSRGDLWSPVFYCYINFSTGCRGTYYVPAIDAISLLPRADGIRPYIIRNKFNVILSVNEESKDIYQAIMHSEFRHNNEKTGLNLWKQTNIFKN